MLRKITVVVLLLLSVGCGDSPEHKMYRAALALRNGLPNEALELADDVLADRPGDVDSMIMKAQAHVQLAQFDEAGTVLEQLIKDDPSLERAHAIHAMWAQQKMRGLMRIQDFPTNADLVEQFNRAMAVGQAEAEWFEVNGKNRAEAQFHLGRLASIDGDRHASIARHYRKSLDTVVLDGDEKKDDGPNIDDIEQQRDQRYDDAEHHYFAAISADPQHFRAATDLTRLLRFRKQYGRLWDLGVKMVDQKDLPNGLVEKLALAILEMPSSVRPVDERIEMGSKLTQIVPEKDRKTKSWQITVARLHVMAKEDADAETVLRDLVGKFPNDQTIRYLLALAHFRQREYEEAKTILDALSTELRGSPRVQSLYGRTLVKTNNKDLAMEPLRRALELDPNDSSARSAFVGAMLENKEMAEHDVNEYFKLSPGDPNAIAMKLNLAISQNERDEVERVLAQTKAIQPLLNGHLESLIDGYIWLGQLERSERYAKQLIRRKDSVANNLLLAQVFMAQNRGREITELMEDLKKRFPGDPIVELARGEYQFRLGKYDAAIETLAEIVAGDTRNKEGRMFLGRALMGLSRYEEAVQQFKAILDFDPTNVDAHRFSWIALKTMGEDKKAQIHLAGIDLTQLNDETSPELIASMYAAKGEHEEAIRLCRDIISKGANTAMSLVLAEIYTAKEDTQAAEATLVEMVGRHRDDPRAYERLADFYFDQKRVSSGLSQFKRMRQQNAVLSRLAEANLLRRTGRDNDALDLLSAVYQPLIKARDGRAMLVAHEMAKIHLKGKNVDAAIASYEPMVKAGLRRSKAMLFQVDLAAGSGDRGRTIARLDALAKRIGADERALQRELIARYVAFQQIAKAVEILGQWIKAEPNNAGLLMEQARMLSQLGKHKQAIVLAARAIEAQSDVAGFRMELAELYRKSGDFPAAIQTYRETAGAIPNVKLACLSGMADIYLSIGLHEQVVETVAELERTGQSDPRVTFVAGNALFSLGRNDEAFDRLSKIGPFTDLYVKAQIRMADIAMRRGKFDQALKRLKTLLASERHSSVALAELLRSNFDEELNSDLVRATDELVQVSSLPKLLQMRWLSLRLRIYEDRGEWDKVIDNLDRLIKLAPDRSSYITGKIAILHWTGKNDDARRLYKGNPSIGKSAVGGLLGVALEESTGVKGEVSGFSEYIRDLVAGDRDAAIASLSRMQSMRMLFRIDLKAYAMQADRADAGTMRHVALAQVASSLGFAQLAEEISRKVLEKNQKLFPVAGIAAEALGRRGKPTDWVFAHVQKHFPGTGLGQYLQLKDHWDRKEYQEALQIAKTLRDRVPENEHIAFNLIQLQQRVGEIDDAMRGLDALWASPGTYQAAAGNELAYLIAEHAPDRHDEAYLIAKKVLSTMKQNQALVTDTLGWLEHKRRNNESALSHLNKSVLVLNGSAEVHYHLGATYAASGNSKWARLHLAAAHKRAIEGSGRKNLIANINKLHSSLSN